MAVRRGPNHALVTVSTSLNSIGMWIANAITATSEFFLSPSSATLNSLTNLGTTAPTGAYGAYGTTGTQYYYKLLDVVSGLF